MNKSITHSYKQMIKDTSQSLYDNKYYFEGKNIRLIATDSQSTGSCINEKGNSLLLTIPSLQINYSTKEISYLNKTLQYTTDEINYNNQPLEQEIVAHKELRDYLILFTLDNNGFNCIWKVDYITNDITLLYLRKLGFNKNYPIQIVNNYENEVIDKIYWVDSLHQLRFLNTKHSIQNGDLEELIDVSEKVLTMSGIFNFSQPQIIRTLTGGTHTAGMIQYCYNLYRLNSSQTKLSPLSKLIPLDKGVLGGGQVNEVVSTIPVVRIEDIDLNYTNIRVYSIKYTSFNETPIISLIEDTEIPQTGVIEIFDDNTPIETLSLEEFIFLGSDIIIPKHIQSKDNRLFFANYEEKNFEIKLDTRAYSHNSSGISKVYNNIKLYQTGDVTPNINGITGEEYVVPSTFTDIYDEKFDSINLDYDTYKYQKNGITTGGEGKYLKYELVSSSEYDRNAKYFKDEEIYRLGIHFYNSFGQISLPSWIADFKSKNGNLQGSFNTLSVTLKPDFYVWLNTSSNFLTEYDKPVGYRILLAERTVNDRTIVSNGLLGTMMINIPGSVDDQNDVFVKMNSSVRPKLPNILLRNCGITDIYGNTIPARTCSHLSTLSVQDGPATEMWRAYYGDKDTTGRSYQFNSMLQLYSPETLFLFNNSLNSGLKLKIKGLLNNKYNSNWAKEIDLHTFNVDDEVKTINCLSSHFGYFIGIAGNAYNVTDRGLISHPGGKDPHRMEKNLIYRGYGDVLNNNVVNDSVNVLDIQNDLTLVSGTDPDGNALRSSLKSIKLILDDVYSSSDITYTITPDLAFNTTNYDIKICSDPNGNNVLDALFNVNGTQTITISNSFTPTTDNENLVTDYYIVFNSLVAFDGSFDVDVLLNGTSTFNKESLNNTINYTPNSNLSYNIFTPVNSNNIIDIYGSPELTELGQNYTTYNNDVNYRYTNSLTSVITDGDSSWKDDGNCGRKILSIFCNNARCITFVTGDDVLNINNWDRPTLDSIFADLGLNINNSGLIGELVKSNSEIYLGGIYGGNSWENKKRTNYFEIGDYKPILQNFNYIDSPGDTYVDYFRFLRISKIGNIDDQCTKEYEEIVEFYTETTIHLKNRNDLSLNDWDNKFSYNEPDYHKYNTVYSQNSNLFTRRNINYNIKKNNNFDTNIISSKLKSSGELIDSWTDILVNEVITLDGKFGPITSLNYFNDEIYSFQDRGFAFISINPRVQVQGTDGLAIELGSGTILQDYKYISTESGTINKWSVVVTPSGIYYFDLLNKSFNMFNGNIKGVSDLKQMHSYFYNNSNFNILKNDNPIIKQGISSGYDYINNDVLMSFHQNEKSFTISFNESENGFISLYDYIPSFYISRGDYYVLTNNNNKSLYKQFAGNYNEFFGVKYPSYIIFNVNPEPNKDCVFDNINFKSECYLNNIDQSDITINKIQAFNDYQDSTLIPLTVGRNGNIRRKFRDWNLLIPRQVNKRERIRSPWIKVKLQFDNTNNYKLILHNPTFYYTTY